MNKKRGTILVVLGLFLLVMLSLLSLAETSGCYVYSEASEDLYCLEGVLDTEAQEDCDFYSDCNMAQDFITNSDCSELDVCQEVVCNVDCQLHSVGKCEQLGGNEVPEGEYGQWCSPGCCKIVDKFCQFNLLQFQCLDKAIKLGQSNYDLFLISGPEMNANICNTEYCGIEIEKSDLTIFVTDIDGKGISANIVFEGKDIEGLTDDSGYKIFTSLNPGTYAVKVNAENYLESTAVVSLPKGKQIQHNFTLQKSEAIADIHGTIKGPTETIIIPQATVSWSGPVSGQVLSDDLGEYEITELPKGDFVITVSKIGYKTITKNLAIKTAVSLPIDFTLETSALLGISGTVYRDTNNDKEWDVGDEKVYGASIYINNVFRGFSTYPDGTFAVEIELVGGEEDEKHTISASFQNYEFEPEEFTFTGAITGKILLLTAYIGECTELGQEAENFSALPVPGKKEIKLEWDKPCPEVLSYDIIKFFAGEKIETIHASPTEDFIFDTNVEWGQEYTYKIVTNYDKSSVEGTTEIPVNVGDKDCAGRYNEVTKIWDTFCRIGEKSIRKTVWRCNNLNNLELALDCSSQDDPGDYYCAQVTSTTADCKNSGGCDVFSQKADPFGLYFSRESCYGTATPEEEGTVNFCYYDFTDTIVNECKDCTKIDSCFDYKSKDACEIDNCLFGGTKCGWVDSAANSILVDYSAINLPLLVTAETGAGYCVEEDYSGTENDPLGEGYCSLCAPTSSLFENYYCTAPVCSGLGRCFSAFDLDLCSSCGKFPTEKSNCYAYNTELECTNGINIQRSIFGEISPSEDSCGWEKCRWTGTAYGYSANGCVKDGDGDNIGDCESFIAGEKNSCRLDNSAPRTEILSEKLSVISYKTPNITFYGDDGFHDHASQNSFLSTLSYCLTNIEFDSCFDQGAVKVFNEESYSGNSVEEALAFNLLNSTFLKSKKIGGETYKIKYYSTDKYHNQETVQENYIYIDNVPPEFIINEEIETIGDLSKLFVYLDGTKEIMSCVFTLSKIYPSGDVQSTLIPREEQIKEVIFDNLNGILYNLKVTCEDDAGNQNIQSKNYTFDLEQNIDLVYPKLYASISDTKIVFKINTIVGATCSLYLTANNEKVADFASDEEGKVHETPIVSGFIEKEYAAEYKAVCNELFDPTKVYEDYFHFTIDFTPPATQIILKEGSREEKPVTFGWEEYFIETVLVDFECLAEGSECQQTFYCLGEGCELVNNENYQEYSASLELKETTEICYYSTDLANNPVYQPLCGEVVIEGYGITLEKPELYYYLDEQWGISNLPIFDWQFFTKVPTTECRFDFFPEFDYEAVPEHKIKQINSAGKYLFMGFPESIFSPYPAECVANSCIKAAYVKCKDVNELVGPEQKIYLEYDPTKPEILAAFANPDEVFEGTSTNLLVSTDDKTLCKYSDNSEGQGSEEYSNMEFSFPGLKEKILNLEHQDFFSLNFVGPIKNYKLLTQCKNGAGDYSNPEEINFYVDYSQIGYIVTGSLLPTGYVLTSNVSLSVETSKNAFCEYDINGEGYVPFTEGANSKFHSAPITELEEKEYLIPVKCMMGDHTAYGQIKFILDLLAPTITKVEDGSFTCGSDIINVMVYSDEGNISKYAYEVYYEGKYEKPTSKPKKEKIKTFYSGYFTNYSSSADEETDDESTETETNTSVDGAPSAGTLVLSAEIGSDLPIKIPTKDLLDGHKYSVKVKAIDAANNEGFFKESDGVVVIGLNNSVCEDDDSPVVEFNVNDSSCTSVSVEMVCKDKLGCKEFLYGEEGTMELCGANITYAGKKILLQKTSWICYYVEDNVGNNHSDNKKIIYSDEDGDKISDHCDQCLSTGAGKIVNEIGCADGEVPESEKGLDTDGDGLPDYWEKNYDAFDCVLSYLNPDSDDNGVADNLEDYDSDGYSNQEEYVNSYNPCLADIPLPEKETKFPPSEPSTGLPSELDEESNLLAWIFLIIGLLMVAGGSGYLIYFYLYGPGQEFLGRKAGLGITGQTKPVNGFRPGIKTGVGPGIIKTWENKLSQLKKSRKEKLKSREREQIFSEFNTESKEIPHLEKLLHHKAPHLSKLKDLAQRYSEHKEEIKPGLRKEEKSVFSQLENISKKTKNKTIREVVNKEEAKDIFSQLKDLSKKRKIENKSKVKTKTKTKTKNKSKSKR
jgi:hypothetical protein